MSDVLGALMVFLAFVGGPVLLVQHAFRVRRRRRLAWTPPPSIPRAHVHRGGPPPRPPPPPQPPGLSTIETLGVVLLIGWIALWVVGAAFYVLVGMLFDGNPMRGFG